MKKEPTANKFTTKKEAIKMTNKDPLILSPSMKALFSIDTKCYSPVPSTCSAAMAGHDDKGQLAVVCVDPEKPCKWRPKTKSQLHPKSQ